MSFVHDQEAIRCTIIRGGTSKALFFHINDLPRDPKLRDEILLTIMGSPNIMQIDGLGGANIPTSKIAIIGPPTLTGTDVDYTFAQVGINEKWIDFNGNCGNISSGVGLYALFKGLIAVKDPSTSIKIHQVNTNKIIHAKYETQDKRICSIGEYEIPGVENLGSYISLDFSECIGIVNGDLLPTGKVVEHLKVDDKNYDVSIVDIANPCVFIDAKIFGFNGDESAEEMNLNANVLSEIEKVRSKCAEKLGLVKSWEFASIESPTIPMVVLVSKKKTVESNIDFLARIVALQKVHRQFTVTGAVCTAVASQIEGTVVHQNSTNVHNLNNETIVSFGHPTGKLEIRVRLNQECNNIQVERAEVGRTARILMDGYVYYPKNKILYHEKLC